MVATGSADLEWQATGDIGETREQVERSPDSDWISVEQLLAAHPVRTSPAHSATSSPDVAPPKPMSRGKRLALAGLAGMLVGFLLASGLTFGFWLWVLSHERLTGEAAGYAGLALIAYSNFAGIFGAVTGGFGAITGKIHAAAGLGAIGGVLGWGYMAIEYGYWEPLLFLDLMESAKVLSSIAGVTAAGAAGGLIGRAMKITGTAHTTSNQ
jgi:hypothetical protein